MGHQKRISSKFLSLYGRVVVEAQGLHWQEQCRGPWFEERGGETDSSLDNERRVKEYKGIQKHSSRRPSEASSLGLQRRAIAPVVRWRQRTVCLCALTDTSLHASGGVHERATGRPHLSDGSSRSHWGSRTVFVYHMKVSYASGALVLSRSHSGHCKFSEWGYVAIPRFQLCLTGCAQCMKR